MDVGNSRRSWQFISELVERHHQSHHRNELRVIYTDPTACTPRSRSSRFFEYERVTLMGTIYYQMVDYFFFSLSHISEIPGPFASLGLSRGLTCLDKFDVNYSVFDLWCFFRFLFRPNCPTANASQKSAVTEERKSHLCAALPSFILCHD